MYRILRNILKVVPFIICYYGFYNTYGALFFPGLNSDHAVHILMSEDFSFPGDLYFAKQSRLGSLIPALAYVGQLVFPAEPITVVSLVQLLLLGLAAFMIQKLASDYLTSVLAILIILFPAMPFDTQVMIGHPNVAHLFFLGLLVPLHFSEGHFTSRRYGYLIPLLCALGIWASELFLANILALLLLFHKDYKHLLGSRSNQYKWAVATLLGIVFLVIAKVYAFPTGYGDGMLATPEGIYNGLVVHGQTIWRNLTFTTPNNVGNLALCFTLIVLVVFLKDLVKENINKRSRFFLYSGLIHILAVLVSGWSSETGHPLRHYSLGVCQLLLGMVFFYDGKKVLRFSRIALSLTVLLISLSGLYWVFYGNYRVDQRLSREAARSIAESSGNISVLGTYWNSYLIEAFNPGSIVSTPHEGAFYRIHSNLESFFTKDSVMVVGLGYLDHFPDTLRQFGGVLVKSSDAISFPETDIAYYSIWKPRKKFYSIHDLNLNVEPIPKGNWLTIDNTTRIHNPTVVYGPYCTLREGKYAIKFKLKASDIKEGKRLPYVDVVTDHGTQLLRRKKLKSGIANPEITLELKRPESLIEFRLRYFENGNIKFGGVQIRPL